MRFCTVEFLDEVKEWMRLPEKQHVASQAVSFHCNREQTAAVMRGDKHQWPAERLRLWFHWTGSCRLNKRWYEDRNDKGYDRVNMVNRSSLTLLQVSSTGGYSGKRCSLCSFWSVCSVSHILFLVCISWWIIVVCTLFKFYLQFNLLWNTQINAKSIFHNSFCLMK